MPLVYITGISASGKSSVCKELKRRGYEAYDADKDGVAFFYNNETGKAITKKIAPKDRTPEWRAKHTWKAKREDVKKLAREAKDKLIFLCGVTSNDADELWDLFDQVFALTIDEATLRHRVTSRTNNDFGKNPNELADLLRWQRTASEGYKKLGAILIDAAKPLDEVADEILKQTKQPPTPLFADTSLAKKIASAAYPAARIQVIDYGYDNIVVLIDTTYALRFPRDQDAYTRNLYEKQILRHLKNLRAIALPEVVGEHANPSYFITSFVRGEHLSPAAVRGFSVKLQRQLGEDIATFAYGMHSLFSVDEANRIRKKLRLDKEESWSAYFKRLLYAVTLPDARQDRIAKAYYKKWQAIDNTSCMVAIHDDLHNENILFEGSRLCGVLDFGDTTIGTAEQELRQLYRINETVLNAAIDKYSTLAGRALDIEAAKTWAIMQELAAYAELLAKGDTSHPTFARAARNLNEWLEMESWGEGLASLESKGCQ